MITEIKSSMSKEDVYAFQREVEFYEKKQKVRVEREGIISPFVDPGARAVTERLGIEVYTSGYDVAI